jgi:phosphohistidine phosphatase
MGAYLAENDLVPQRAIVSSAVRTRQTWTLMTPAFSRKPKATFEQRIYEASPHTILSVIKETPASVKSLMIVGHNPGLQSLALALVGSGDDEARDALARKFPTAALAVIDFPGGDWQALRPGTGILERFVTPKSLTGDED